MKIYCPYHKDDTASLHIYEDGFYCFGCGKSGSNEYLKKSVNFNINSKKKEYEDLKGSFDYINKLPLETIRGLRLPVDDFGYYITWPDMSYYKKRKFSGNSSDKYYCPKGHTQPILVVQEQGQDLVIVEGELNALSLGELDLPVTIVSPGGTAQMYSKKNLTFYKNYDNIKIVVDSDSAGVLSGLKLKADLIEHTPNIDVILLIEDANKMLVKYDKEKFRKEIEEKLGLS